MNHRSNPNNQAETRQIQKPVGDLIFGRTNNHKARVPEFFGAPVNGILRRPANLPCRGTGTVECSGSGSWRDRENFRQGTGGARTRIPGTAERVGWRDRGRIRGTVEGVPWEQVRESSLGNRAGAEGTGEQRGMAAGEDKEIKSKV